MTPLAATLYVRRAGADYRIRVTPAGVVWVERQRPAGPNYALQLMPLQAGALWADDVWNYEAIGEALDQYEATIRLELDDLASTTKRD